MSADSSPPVSDKGRLLFGSGFVFGVMFAMVVLAMVTVTVVDRPVDRMLVSDAIFTIGAGIVFTAIVGVSLYVLAFPENRLELPVENVVGTDDGDE